MNTWLGVLLLVCARCHCSMGHHKGNCLHQFSRSAVSEEVKGGFFSFSGEFKDRLETYC